MKCLNCHKTDLADKEVCPVCGHVNGRPPKDYDSLLNELKWILHQYKAYPKKLESSKTAENAEIEAAMAKFPDRDKISREYEIISNDIKMFKTTRDENTSAYKSYYLHYHVIYPILALIVSFATYFLFGFKYYVSMSIFFILGIAIMILSSTARKKIPLKHQEKIPSLLEKQTMLKEILDASIEEEEHKKEKIKQAIHQKYEQIAEAIHKKYIVDTDKYNFLIPEYRKVNIIQEFIDILESYKASNYHEICVLFEQRMFQQEQKKKIKEAYARGYKRGGENGYETGYYDAKHGY